MSTPKPHPARRARRITGAVSAASFVGLDAWFAAHAPSTMTTGSSSTKSVATDLDDEIEQAATSYSSSTASSASTASTASGAHTTSGGS